MKSTLPWTLAVIVLLACGKPAAPQTVRRHLDPSQWLATNRARIDRLLDQRWEHAPVAVFDWDNTMMRNDIGDATFFWMLAHDQILQPPNRDWSQTNRRLTPAARESLKACHAIAEPNQPLPTSTNAACADAIVRIYDRGNAFEDETTVMMHQPYAWSAQLQAGHTPDEIRSFAARAFAENAAAPIGTTQTIGTTRGLTAWVRIYEPMRDLVGALQSNGFDVWVVSASSQPLAETVGAMVGIDSKHVVGVRTILRPDGRLDYRIQGCGTEADGADTVITYDRGKRCWINRAIFGLAPAEQLSKANDPKKRPVFAAGDSDTDLAMVQDATMLKLTINRNRPLLMCSALNDSSGRWMIQPMFIEPAPRQAAAYPCGAIRDHAGQPATDEDGKPMNDKTDAIE